MPRKLRPLWWVLLCWCVSFPLPAEDRGVKLEAAGSPPSPEGQAWSVVVGINEFDEEDVIPLSYAVADARAFFEEITRPDGLVKPSQAFLHISGVKEPDGMLYPPTRKAIMKSIKFVAEKAAPEDLVLIYFSSHGFLDPKTRHSYIMPENGDLDLLEEEAIPVAWLQNQLGEDQCQARRRILIVDACRNKTTRGTKGVTLSEASAGLVEELRQAKGLVTLFSCGPGEVSYEDNKVGHGVFTHYILEGLRGQARNTAGLVTATGLALFVREQVVAWCNQNQKDPTQDPRLMTDLSGDIALSGTSSLLPLPNAEKPPLPLPVAPPSDFSTESLDLPGGIRIEMVYLPGDGNIAPFWMGKFEITQAQWKAAAAGLPRVAHDLEEAPAKIPGENLPVENISLEDCQEFCQRLSKHLALEVRLPTEAEWDYAVRGGSGERYFWGSDSSAMPRFANIADRAFLMENESPAASDKTVGGWMDGFARTSPVGSFEANPFNLHDMLGNVGEWVDGGKERVYRGGTWGQNPDEIDLGTRKVVSPKTRPSGFVGFRIARSSHPR